MSRTPDARRPTAVIADDEALARRRILDLLRRGKAVAVVGECSTGTATLNTVRAVRPDLLFLDVQMPSLDGFEVLAALEPDERPVVIFSTAYDEYALAAFDAAAVDYLLKPYDDERFEQALARATRALRNEQAGEVQRRLQAVLEHPARAERDPASHARWPSALDRFAVPGRNGFEVIDAEEIDWIEASGDYVTLHVGEAEHLLRGTMTSLEERLDPASFVRVHRSTIVRIDAVRRLRSDPHGDWCVELARGGSISVSRTYRDRVLARVGLRW